MMLPVAQRSPRLALIASGLLGICMSVYLLIIYVRERGEACGAGGNCPLIADYEYAQLVGVPLPVIGIMGFVLIVAAAVMDNDRARLIGTMIPIAGCLLAGWMMYVEYSEIGSVSAWTLTLTAFLVVALSAAIWRERSVFATDNDVSATDENPSGGSNHDGEQAGADPTFPAEPTQPQ